MAASDEATRWRVTYDQRRAELDHELASGRVTPDTSAALRRELERINVYYTVLTPAEREDLHCWERANLGDGRTGTGDWPGWRHHGLLGFGTTPARHLDRPGDERPR